MGDLGEYGRIRLYTDENFEGRKIVFTLKVGEKINDLSEHRLINYIDIGTWNDKTSSLIIDAGVWKLYVNAGLDGEPAVLGPGKYPDFGHVGQGVGDDQLSSLELFRLG